MCHNQTSTFQTQLSSTWSELLFFYCETVNQGNGLSQPKKGKYSRISDSTKQIEVQSQKDPPCQEISIVTPEIHQHSSKIQVKLLKNNVSGLLGNIKDTFSDDVDYYTEFEDEFIESKCCEIFVDERDGEVSIRFLGQVKAIVRENWHFEPDTKDEVHYSFRQFESAEQMKILTACIPVDATQIKSSRLSDVVQFQSQKVPFRSQIYPSYEIFILLKTVLIKQTSKYAIYIQEGNYDEVYGKIQFCDV
ncbi:MAG: hypothetical protein EZS28_025910 [Streblomastix strix]|uniref:Uncharacterized protein n=1 Tax=Streblomastix strix TaxID=222440 RepID=A0A5J4V7V2_9EUKA|nr:MAG: hypothetical protein EZS28_025910 [Streblomastix strix]